MPALLATMPTSISPCSTRSSVSFPTQPAQRPRRSSPVPDLLLTQLSAFKVFSQTKKQPQPPTSPTRDATTSQSNLNAILEEDEPTQTLDQTQSSSASPTPSSSLTRGFLSTLSWSTSRSSFQEQPTPQPCRLKREFNLDLVLEEDEEEEQSHENNQDQDGNVKSLSKSAMHCL